MGLPHMNKLGLEFGSTHRRERYAQQNLQAKDLVVLQSTKRYTHSKERHAQHNLQAKDLVAR